MADRVDKDRIYSTLEAISQQHTNQTSPEPISQHVDLGKQVFPDSDLQTVVNHRDIEPVAQKNLNAKIAVDDQVLSRQRWRRKIIIICISAVLILILVGILGGVLGSRSRHSRSATTLSTPRSNSTPSAPPPISPQRNIAALSFASESVNKTRVYFQDDVGQIMEAANFENNTSWSTRGIGFIAKNGSAIAAAVSRKGFPLVRHAFVLRVCGFALICY